MTDGSRQFLPAELKGIAPRLMLSSDGTFSVVDLPGAFHGSFVIVANSGRGTWKIAAVDGREQVQSVSRGVATRNFKFRGTPALRPL
jgi:hypothetical protein